MAKKKINIEEVVSVEEDVKAVELPEEIPEPAEETKTYQRFIYVGPSSLADGLFNRQIFIGRPAFTSLREKYPLLNVLIVPIAEVAVAMEGLERKGSAQYLAKQQILKGGQ